ncbi:ATP-binding protein [Maribellus sediminis]|uniref:ATP-binding protein n=1 Tax=Maribellus sediminis TaxID=2696285 RepID=UPI001430796F|nr:ATP-binding protein [Maribellus sediminis]
MIPRAIDIQIINRLENSEKIVVLYGARQVGKTTLVNSILEKRNEKILSINADQLKYREVLSSADLNQLRRLVAGYDLLFIDEAQRVPDIGLNLKILHDNLPQLKIIATGSSSFELANKISEPLTGRIWTYSLFPVSILEWSKLLNPFELDEKLSEFLMFGMYPELFRYENELDKMDYLRELVQSFLYKDLLELSQIKNSGKIFDLLRLLAHQIGSTVSYNELGKKLGLSTDTVISYIDLLEKVFVIYRMPGYSKNLRKEITKNKKIYFYDVGVRNAIIEDFTLPEKRQDIGHLWENFIVSERLKRNAYLRAHFNSFFWRTYTGAELDYVEQGSGKLSGFEIKWGDRMSKVPKSWSENYPEADFQTVNIKNYQDFVL